MRPSSGEWLRVPGWSPNLPPHPAPGKFLHLCCWRRYYYYYYYYCSPLWAERLLQTPTAMSNSSWPPQVLPAQSHKTGQGPIPTPAEGSQLWVLPPAMCHRNPGGSWGRGGGKCRDEAALSPRHRCRLPHRTATVWKTLSPFWGEEYEVHLQPTFHSVSIYVMDEDALRYGQVVGARGLVTMAACMLNPVVDTGESTPGRASSSFGTQMGEVTSRGYFLAGSRRWQSCSVGPNAHGGPSPGHAGAWFPPGRGAGLPCLGPAGAAGSDPTPCPAPGSCFPAATTLSGRSASPGTCWRSTPRVRGRVAGSDPSLMSQSRGEGPR